MPKLYPIDLTTKLSEQLAQMQAAHLTQMQPSYALRKDRLLRLEKGLLAYQDRFISAMQADFSHRSAAEAKSIDVTLSLGDIRMNRRKLRRWMRPRNPGMPLQLRPARGRIVPQPKGVVGILSPWNFPLFLSIPPMAGAIAAGNRVMLKPSEHTPRTSQLLADMVAEFFDPLEAHVCLGGAKLAAEFSALPFDHLLFTGSTEVGRLVAQAAAKNLTPVTLELGGKSPVIIGEYADMKRAARRIAFGKTMNAGQSCVAPDYAMVPRAKQQEFTALLTEAIRDLYPNFTDGSFGSDYTAIISDAQRQRLDDLITAAEVAGVKTVRLGQTKSEGSRQMPPVLLIDPPNDITAMQSEIFGPILSLVPYDNAADAAKFVRERPAPLALYIFTNRVAERNFWLQNTTSGGVCVNETSYHVVADTLPFGGIGPSGMGGYHGKVGFDTFSHLRAVFYQHRINGVFLFDPPTSRFKRTVARILQKII